MSWVKRRGQSTPSPAAMQPPPPVPMYNPNQHHSNQTENWQQPTVQPQTNSWYHQQNQQQKQYNLNQQPPPQQQQNYWQTTQTFNQQPPHMYNQNTNQFGQYNPDPNSYYQNTGYQQQQPQNYSNMQYNQHNNTAYNQPQPQQQQQQTEGDSWNWGWGDEDNSNVQPQLHVNSNSNQLTDSFANDETWNWSVEETASTTSVHHQSQESQPEVFQKMGKLTEKHLSNTENQSESPLMLDQLPSSGKRNKIDNLTPQWSIESQISQESSDDILHTSESDKSHMLSRSSTISQSPISGHDSNNVDGFQNNTHESQENFEHSGQHENKEILTTAAAEVGSIKANPTPPPPMKNQTPPLSAPLKNQTPPLMPPMKNQTPPLMPLISSNKPEEGGTNKNQYKRTTPLSHKAANRFKTGQPEASKQTYFPNPMNFNQSVNLETLPDNSEQPDSLPPMRKISATKPVALHQLPENNEVAPINDRNQYLETGQLSDSASNLQEDTLPPPGLRRMVLGQMEQQESNATPDTEPPPGFHRMVVGQTESGSNNNQTEPPIGLHRMIPGESSSPESRPQQYQDDDYISETELNQLTSNIVPPQQRSATIGADTPPSTQINRSETIGADTPLVSNTSNTTTSSSLSESRIGAIGLDNTITADEDNPSTQRRDSVEGQPQDTEISSLVTSVRDLTVGENPTDGATSATSIPESKPRRLSRGESSDSEHETRRHKSTRDDRDRWYREKEERFEREKGRERYSPDSYRDKKYERRRYRDRRYEEDTDYYSDKEREWKSKEERARREEHEKKYSSLRRDKDRDKRRRDPREHRDPRDPREYGRDNRRGDYYYRYEDDYENDARSRPSSRSDSMHESFRERGPERDHRDRRHRDRDRDHHRRHRDPFNSYMQGGGYGFDPYNPYYQYQYQYYENLRRTNPQAYAEMYRKYYSQAASTQGTYGNEDRASVHSGRSSANDELAKDRYTRQSYYSQTSLPQMGYYRESQTHSVSGHYGLDDSSYNRPFDHTDSSLNFEESNLSTQRMTPVKFATAHVKASIESGHLIKVLPNYPLDGQSPTVEIISLPSLLTNDEEFKELSEFPGPLLKGITHKKTIIEYCENKIRGAAFDRDINDAESYVLLWELLILLIRQNGMVVGTDIAELLMKDRNTDNARPASVASTSSVIVENADNSQASETTNFISNAEAALKEEIVTNKFREYLIYGSGKEALEWAMKHGLWGHALFLASKLDKRTYANVMMRFANGLTMNDPLQTLYQLLSGRLPAAVTSVVDEKWGDWRPHLAMILSNTTQRPELDRKAITTLADTLLSRGSLYAAQFCYLMADIGFSRYGSENAKLVLLGSNHNKPFPQFATNEAIHMTEIYEYACSLNDSAFLITEFQLYKYILATRLADRGLLEKALGYLEKVSVSILQNPKAAQPSLVNNVCKLADRLKYYDPIEDLDDSILSGGDPEDTSRPGNTWLKDLRAVQRDYSMGLITHESLTNLASATPDLDPAQNQVLQGYEQSSSQEVWQQQQYQQQNEPQQQWQQEQLDPNFQQQYQQPEQFQEGFISQQYQAETQQQQYWNNQQQQQWSGINSEISSPEYQAEHQTSQNDYWNQTQTEDGSRPQISMPNQSQGRSIFDEDKSGNSDQNAKNDQAKAKSPVKAVKPQDKQPSTGWFGGIFSKLALRPKNQMKLPDDKNPTIVWDPEKKRWINLEEENNEGTNELKPPPKMSEMFAKTTPAPSSGSQPVPQQAMQPAPAANPPVPMGTGNQISAIPSESAGPPKPSQPNMFKLQRNRNLKKSYVDVFNPSGKSAGNGQASLPAPEIFNATPAAPMNFFVPQPISDPNAPMDFLTPAPMQTEQNSQQQMYQQQQ